MHVLRCILINLEQRMGKAYEIMDRDALIEAAITQALYLLDKNYKNDIFDWRENNAGRWINEYPESCITGKFDRERFLKEFEYFSRKTEKDLLKYFREKTKNEIKRFGGSFIDYDNDTLIIKVDKKKIRRFFKDRMNFIDPELSIIYDIARLINGHIYEDSNFINTVTWESFVDDNQRREIYNNPEKYALVFIDTHY